MLVTMEHTDGHHPVGGHNDNGSPNTINIRLDHALLILFGAFGCIMVGTNLSSLRWTHEAGLVATTKVNSAARLLWERDLGAKKHPTTDAPRPNSTMAPTSYVVKKATTYYDPSHRGGAEASEYVHSYSKGDSRNLKRSVNLNLEEPTDEHDVLRSKTSVSEDDIEDLQGNIAAEMTSSTPNPCHLVDAGMPDTPAFREECESYLSQPYIVPNCSEDEEVVPRIYHSVSASPDMLYHQEMTATSNPSFRVNHLGDAEAAAYIREHCGDEAAQAYDCFAPPAYRADLFRFCALTAEGGVYLDADIMPWVPLLELYSPCSTATVGHDFAWKGHPGKQMKILASAPGTPIFQCALEKIVDHVKNRFYPDNELAVSGPQLLQACYEQYPQDVAITYHDTRNAVWPYTGMRQGTTLLAYELPLDASKHFWQWNSMIGDVSTPDQDDRMLDYTKLFQRRQIYKESCPLTPPSSTYSTQQA